MKTAKKSAKKDQHVFDENVVDIWVKKTAIKAERLASMPCNKKF